MFVYSIIITSHDYHCDDDNRMRFVHCTHACKHRNAAGAEAFPSYHSGSEFSSLCCDQALQASFLTLCNLKI